MRVRGLKLRFVTRLCKLDVSHPMRVRGLKYNFFRLSCMIVIVAPHAGAWIEIAASALKPLSTMSHPMRVRGLKSFFCFMADGLC